MTKIKATFLEGDTKYHISRPGGVPACNADAYFPYSNKTELPRKSVCKNCLRSSRAEYEEIHKHIPEMPEGYRIMKVGEVITECCLSWQWGKGPWNEIATDLAICYNIGEQVTESHHPICCPVDVQKTPETSDNADRGEPVSDKEYHGGLATPEERDRLLSRIAELERKNELLIQTIEANPSKAKVAELEKERDELKRKVDQLIAIDKRVTDYIDDLHREHEAEVNELKRRLDASAKALDAVSEYVTATKGHTIENITTFIEAMPPAEELEGCAIECVGKDRGINQFELLFRVQPIVEYIPTEDITDALARDRVVCDVRYSCKTQWIPAVLLVVDGRPEKSVKYLVQLIESEDFVWFQVDHCRIRKDTIESLRGNK